MKKLGERMITLDCDVLVADGGTRQHQSPVPTALEPHQKLIRDRALSSSPIIEPLAALSIGINKDNKIIADLNYEEDSSCETDMNIVLTESGKFIELQGTAEGSPFSREHLDALVDCSMEAMKSVFAAQKEVLK